MTTLTILEFPDPRLRTIAEPVTEFNSTLAELVQNMLETMYDAPGVGLAAPQVGSLHRLFVMDCTGKEEDAAPMVLINPKVVWTSEETSVYNEGCLSIPEMYEDVERPERAVMQFLDIDGVEREQEFDGLWATCAQHELDHLNGVLFIDYLSGLKRRMITKKMMKLKKERARG